MLAIRFGAAVNALVMDGSDRTFTPSMEIVVWRALATRNGGEAIP